MKEQMFNWVLKGGTVLDGRGGAGRRADVGIIGDRIAAVGDLSGAEKGGGTKIYDATGCWVCPGFIDAHSHSDAYLLVEPGAASKVRQGVTTEITGNCGASAAPRKGGYVLPSDWLEQRYPGDWGGVGEYRALLEKGRPAVNSLMLAGHRALRSAVMGSEARAATGEEIGRMVGLLEEAMEEGAGGMSTGLIYAPAMFAEEREIHALARVVARRGGVYATHMRSEGARLIEAVEEALRVARGTGVKLQISHLKTAGRANWGKLERVLELIERAREEGLDVAADRYPYTASATDLDVILPEWAEQGGRAAILARLRDPETRRKIREEMALARGEEYWEGVWVGSTRAEENRAFTGRPLGEAAAAWGCHPLDAALRLMDTDELFTGGIFFGMCEENLWRIWGREWVMAGSDASLRSPEGPLSLDHPHPRAYGTFGRFLRAAMEGKGGVGPEEAVRKMTSLPAERFGLKGRGVLEKGAMADVTVVNPARVRDAATYGEPHRFCEGVEGVWVNGVCEVDRGGATSGRGGRYLSPC